jgi:TPR repeat protein
VCYENGKGVPANFEEAAKWYRKAAEQGEADAQFALGRCYEEGKGVLADYEEAMKWYRKAADQGHADAERQYRKLTTGE